jgi:hypothetical protein
MLIIINTRAIRTFAENHSDLQSSLNKLFRVAPQMSWFAFANHLSTDLEESFGANSIEEIHDGVHDIVGGNGHMSDSAVAGQLLRLVSKPTIRTETSFVDSVRSDLLPASRPSRPYSRSFPGFGSKHLGHPVQEYRDYPD